MTDALRAQLAMPYPRDKEGRTYAEVIAERACKKAVQGSVQALSEIGDRTEGRPAQAVELSGPNGEAIDVNIQGLADAELDAQIRALVRNLGLAGPEATPARAVKRKGKKAGKK